MDETAPNRWLHGPQSLPVTTKLCEKPKMKLRALMRTRLFLFFVSLAMLPHPTATAEIKAGASAKDITLLAPTFFHEKPRVHAPLFARALVLHDGKHQVAPFGHRMICELTNDDLGYGYIATDTGYALLERNPGAAGGCRDCEAKRFRDSRYDIGFALGFGTEAAIKSAVEAFRKK